jgi:plasmid stabilization system protein ParE
MNWPLVFHPDVEEEVRDAYQWYENRQPGLGDDFLTALETVYAALRSTPERHQIIERDIRHSRLRRFPYAVYYRVLADRVEVIAVHHGSRNPNTWRSRI